MHTDSRKSGMSRHWVLELAGHAADAVRNTFQHHGELAMPVAVQDTVEQKQGAKPAQLEQDPLERDVASSKEQDRVAEDVVVAKRLVAREAAPPPKPQAVGAVTEAVVEHRAAGAVDAIAGRPRAQTPLGIDLVDEEPLLHWADRVHRFERDKATG